MWCSDTREASWRLPLNVIGISVSGQLFRVSVAETHISDVTTYADRSGESEAVRTVLGYLKTGLLLDASKF